MHETQQAVTVEEAAARLQTSQDAIRKRLRRGTLDGTKARDGIWTVYLPAEEMDAGDGTARHETSQAERRDRTSHRAPCLECERWKIEAERWQHQAEETNQRLAEAHRLLDQQQQLAAATLRALPPPEPTADQGQRRKWWQVKIW